MDDLIRRHAAMTMPVLPKEHRDYISFELDDIYEQGWNECQSFITKLPSADRPQGEWILECDGEGECDNLYRCSECGCEYGCQEYDIPNFCPNCGADMRGGTE